MFFRLHGMNKKSAANLGALNKKNQKYVSPGGAGLVELYSVLKVVAPNPYPFGLKSLL